MKKPSIRGICDASNILISKEFQDPMRNSVIELGKPDKKVVSGNIITSISFSLTGN